MIPAACGSVPITADCESSNLLPCLQDGVSVQRLEESATACQPCPAMHMLVQGSLCCAGRVGSAFAAELGTMAVSEQTDSLRMLGSDPIDYLVSPRVVACMIALPLLSVMCFLMGAPPCPTAASASMRRPHFCQAGACMCGFMIPLWCHGNDGC